MIQKQKEPSVIRFGASVVYATSFLPLLFGGRQLTRLPGPSTSTSPRLELAMSLERSSDIYLLAVGFLARNIEFPAAVPAR